MTAWTPDGPPATTCCWCGAPLHDGERRRGRIVCARCGVATTSPWPTDEQLAEAYGGAYRPQAGRFGGPGDAILQRTRALLARRVDAIAPPGRVLDVGAGDGTLVRALRARGRDALGLEPHVEVAHVTDATVHDLDGPFAAIVLWHSLEHLRDPGATLDRAAQLLVPEGVLVVAVPDASSWQARLFGDDWLALDLPRHLAHIPGDALAERVTQAGLTVERRSPWRGGQVLFGWAHGLTRRIAGHDLYDAIRRPEARFAPLTEGERRATLAIAALTAPVAAAGAIGEIVAGSGGSIHVEARRTR